jgi:hypothetical protein
MRKAASEYFGPNGGSRYFPGWPMIAFAALNLTGALTSTSHAQAPPLGTTLPTFGVLASSPEPPHSPGTSASALETRSRTPAA